MLEEDDSYPVANEPSQDDAPRNRVVDDLVVTENTDNEFLDDFLQDKEVEDDAYGEVNDDDAETADEKRGVLGPKVL